MSSLHLPKLIPNSLHTLHIAVYWSLNSCMSWNLFWYKVIYFIVAMDFICCMCLLLVPPVYTNFFIRASRPIDSRVISKSLYFILDSTWFLVSGSHSNISTAKRFLRFPSSMRLVFKILVMFKSHILFSCTVCLSAKSGYAVLIIFPCLRRIFMLDPFLNCVMAAVAKNEWEGLLFCGMWCFNNNKKGHKQIQRKGAMANWWSNTWNQLDGSDHRLVNERGELQLMAWRWQTKWHGKNGQC